MRRWWGNRGVLVDDAGELARYSRGRAWMICLLEYKGIRRAQCTPGRLTELYFLDEATALAAGHRPCGECRYRDYQAFKRCWSRAFGGGVPSVHDIDARLHEDRLLISGPGSRRDRYAGASVRRTYLAPTASLPTGTMVSVDGSPWLVHGEDLLRWTPGGYTERRAASSLKDAVVLTPHATVAVLAAGYEPVLHITAGQRRGDAELFALTDSIGCMEMLGGWLAGLAVVVSLVAAAGCGEPSRGPVLDSSVAAAPSSSASPAQSAECTAAALTITNADNGKTVCVRPGTRILVNLTNATQPLQHTGPLEPGPPKAFTALREGTATISAVISPCASASGTMHCMVLQLFRVQVEIRAGS